MPQNIKELVLHYKEGSSNKVYQLQLVGNEAEGYKVNFQYGRVGNKLSTGSKTPKCSVDLNTATTIFNEIEREKRAKGYTDNASGTPYQNTENAGKVSGLHCQLLNFIEEDEAIKLLSDNSWVMQEKKDGVRCMIRKKGKVIEGINKKGLVTSLPEKVEAAIHQACGSVDAILDGELVGETFWLFDLIAIGVHALAERPYTERMQEAYEWFSGDFGKNFMQVPTAVGKASKEALWKKLKEGNAEGVVFTKADSKYSAGKPNSGGNRLKYKFYATATVRVASITEGKRSVEMEVLKKGDWTSVGKVTISSNAEIPDKGKYIEVRYLYAYPDGDLFQSTYLGERTDVDDNDCLASQLKLKAEEGTQTRTCAN